MSETSQGPGWWIASDGRWYPPELHPSATAPPRPVPAEGMPPGAPGADLPGFGPVGTAPGGHPTGATADAVPAAGQGRYVNGRQTTRTRSHIVLLVGAAAVVLVLAGLTLGGVVFARTGGIPLGSGTAAVTWSSASSKESSSGLQNGAAAFSGTVAGRSVDGSGGPAPLSNQYSRRVQDGRFRGLPAELPVLNISGTFGGTKFAVTIYVRTADLKSELQQLPSGTDGQITATYDVRGSYGTEAVVGTVTLAGTLSNDTVPPCRLDAHIGALHVTGTIRFDEQPDGQTNSASATYNVSAS